MEVWVWGSGSKARVCIRSRRPDLDLRVHHLALKLSCTSSWNANRHEPQSRLMPPTSPKALSIDEATGRAEAALPGEDHVEALLFKRRWTENPWSTSFERHLILSWLSGKVSFLNHIDISFLHLKKFLAHFFLMDRASRASLTAL